MPEVIKAALTTELAIRNQSSDIIEAPVELQYMPPGTHRINASRNGKPVTLDITVDASTADRLNQFLQEQLTKATEGNDDRPFFDFNHEDREAAAWPTEFFCLLAERPEGSRTQHCEHKPALQSKDRRLGL